MRKKRFDAEKRRKDTKYRQYIERRLKTPKQIDDSKHLYWEFENDTGNNDEFVDPLPNGGKG